MVRDLTIIEDYISQMDNVELFDYLHSVDGHYSDYSSLYIYLAKHPPMDEYYRKLFTFDLSGKTYLELGPGVGASLDVAREQGAKTQFIDRDIFIFKYCQNKGHDGIKLDYFQRPLPYIGQFDVVLSRGSLNVDWMNDIGFDIHYFLFWLCNLGRHVIVIPTWNKGEVVDGNDYTCVGQHLDDYLQSMVHDSFIANGFLIRKIEGINDRLRFPITYERISTK